MALVHEYMLSCRQIKISTRFNKDYACRPHHGPDKRHGVVVKDGPLGLEPATSAPGSRRQHVKGVGEQAGGDMTEGGVDHLRDKCESGGGVVSWQE